ncbi:MAG: UTP--glucose-1-phosphate uridylyltransferase [Verrucomicrobia bacterium]|nr:UTP--glucose-1-phosphate uridylyltransferase [Verrucomicrobiota bacterium]
MSRLVGFITSQDPAVRNQSIAAACREASSGQLLEWAAELDAFRRGAENLYERVRALFFLYDLHRFQLPQRLAADARPSAIPFRGFEQLLHRRFEEAIDTFLAQQASTGASDGLSSALAAAYYRLGFQTLADQVRRSVRTVRGNQWMFRMGHPADQPLRIRPELLEMAADGTYPILREQTPVRMDLTHSAWSDIFFLGMDYPEGARVLNVSVDLGVHGRDAAPRPPVSAWLRVLDEPVLRLTSVDLGATADLTSLAEVFDFARDYLGLLKAAVIAAGLVPPGIEGSGQSLADLLARMLGPGRGLEIVSSVNDIPKGSRLAVSTNLLGSLISVCMRATGQTHGAGLTGPLTEPDRRVVLARALLGEWLGGSGGGWQDSGGVWPGIKLITGVPAGEGDPELGISRGRLMPSHHVFSRDEIPESARQALMNSLVVVHGGMAQNVGPILEMVTEKYLLRCEAEWHGRQDALTVLDEVIAALKRGDIRAVGAATTRNFRQPIQTIIPWASNAFTERLIAQCEVEFGSDFWGFWMLGGMSGGGMGFIFDPRRKREAQERLQVLMLETKRELQSALPFAMDPVVFDYAINEHGTCADLLRGDEALMPSGYYTLVAPALLRQDRHELPAARRTELDKFGAAARTRPELRGMVQSLFDALLPRGKSGRGDGATLSELLERHGFDRAQHEQIRSDIREGRIGLAQNRLRADAILEDVQPGDVVDRSAPGASASAERRLRELGEASLRRGEVAVVSLAAGAGSRWTGGAGTCKALHPYARLAGRHRTFLETHLAKSRRVSRQIGVPLPHVITTSYATHEPTAAFLDRAAHYGYEGPLMLSPGRSVGLRMIPTERDLRFQWEEMPQQLLDVQQQKVRDSLRTALIGWARSAGEAGDYTDNLPLQCLHPVGHFFEIPNLLRNGVLARLLAERPALRHLMLHNIDTLGATADPAMLGQHLEGEACLTFEVITRRLEDRGGGLARVNGQVRLVEGLAMPREEDEFKLSYYNSMTTWIHLDRLLGAMGLTREDVMAQRDERILPAIRTLASRLPTYVTLKEVKKRWGHGQEDVFPVAQFEKLWSDLTALPDMPCRFVVVPRLRGQQLKDPAQLDGWLRDGSAAYVESLCDWGGR